MVYADRRIPVRRDATSPHAAKIPRKARQALPLTAEARDLSTVESSILTVFSREFAAT
jgi:hypothetical protein